MKYIITESQYLRISESSDRLHKKIYEYFDSYFNVRDMTWFNPVDYDDDGNEFEDETRRYYTEDDYFGDAIFRVYFEKDGNTIVQIDSLEDVEILDATFSDMWEPVFKEWFYNNFAIKPGKIV